MKTEEIVCNRYLEIQMQLPSLKNKKKKTAERELQQIIQENPSCKKDITIFMEEKELIEKLQHETEEKFYLENYIDDKVHAVCDILLQKGFLTEENNNYSFTNNGKIASDIAEIHPLILANLINYNNWFEELTIIEILSILSVFTDVNVLKDEKTDYPSSENKRY